MVQVILHKGNNQLSETTGVHSHCVLHKGGRVKLLKVLNKLFTCLNNMVFQDSHIWKLIIHQPWISVSNADLLDKGFSESDLILGILNKNATVNDIVTLIVPPKIHCIKKQRAEHMKRQDLKVIGEGKKRLSLENGGNIQQREEEKKGLYMINSRGPHQWSLQLLSFFGLDILVDNSCTIRVLGIMLRGFILEKIIPKKQRKA